MTTRRAGRLEPHRHDAVSRPLAIAGVTLGARPLLVASGGLDDLDALAGAAGADVVELRADLGDDPTPEAVVAALVRLRGCGRPLLLTVRASAEGGRASCDEHRAAIYAAGLPHADAVDVEIASAALAADLVPRARAAGRLIVLSAHDFERTPPRDALLARIEQAAALGADVTKLATTTDGPGELRTLIEVTLAAAPRAVATLGMGRFGPLSRVVLPAAGSVLTYGAAGAPTAPGQLPAAELAALLERLWPA